MIEHYGYEAETHEVTTEDGYILTVFRCNSKKSTSNRRKVVVIQHGLLDSNDTHCLYPAYSLGETAFTFVLLFL